MRRVTYKPYVNKRRWHQKFVFFRTWVEVEDCKQRRYTVFFDTVWAKYGRYDIWHYSFNEPSPEPDF